MISTQDSPKRVSENSIFFYAPYIWILMACPVATSVVMFTGDSTAIFIGILLFIFSLLSSLVIALCAAFLRRWRRLVAIIASGLIAVMATYSIWRFQDEIHFQVMRPFYNAQLSHEKNVTTEWWDWTPGWGDGKGLAYLENPSLTPPYPSKSGGCTDTIQRLGGNFYLIKYTC